MRHQVAFLTRNSEDRGIEDYTSNRKVSLWDTELSVYGRVEVASEWQRFLHQGGSHPTWKSKISWFHSISPLPTHPVFYATLHTHTLLPSTTHVIKLVRGIGWMIEGKSFKHTNPLKCTDVSSQIKTVHLPWSKGRCKIVLFLLIMTIWVLLQCSYALTRGQDILPGQQHLPWFKVLPLCDTWAVQLRAQRTPRGSC